MKKLPSEKNYLPISEAAKYLGISLDTLRRWDKTGLIKSRRLDGKNRYFSTEDLKKHLSNRPLSISEVSKKFDLSATTLRRLEARGLLKPQRSKAGVRVFDSTTIDAFLKSDYYQRKLTLKKVRTTLKKTPVIKTLPSSPKQLSGEESSDNKSDNKPASYKTTRPVLSHFIAISSATFILLSAVGLGNVFLYKTQNYEMVPLPVVLGEKITVPVKNPAPIENSEPEEVSSASSEEVLFENPASPLEKYISESLNMINENRQKRYSQADLLRLIEIAATDSGKIAIHEQPDTLSSVVGSAENSEVFEFLSFNSGWIELRLHESTRSGFIQEKNAVVKEFEFLTPQSGWTNLYDSTRSGLTGPAESVKESLYDQSLN